MHEQQRIGYWSQLAILLGLVGGGLVLASIASLGIILTQPGLSMEKLSDSLQDPKYASLSKWLQLLSSVLMFGLPALIFGYIVKGKVFNYLGFNRRLTSKQIGYVCIIAFSALFVGAALSELTSLIPLKKSLETRFTKMEEDYSKSIMAIANMKNFADYLFVLFLLAVLPAITEELIFRSCLQKVWIGIFKNAFLGILVTSVLFSAVHASYYGFLTRLMLGILLGYIYYFSRNCWLNMLLHFINNAIGVTQLYFLSRAGKLNVKSMDDHFPWYISIVSAVVIVYLMTRFKKESASVVAYEVATNATTETYSNNNLYKTEEQP